MHSSTRSQPYGRATSGQRLSAHPSFCRTLIDYLIRVLLVFIDETGDVKFKDYLGFCVATMNARFYAGLKSKVQKALSKIEWDPATEFKGSYLFSKSSGTPDVEVERRIDAAREILDLNIALKNSRIRFCYGAMKSTNPSSDYLDALPGLLKKALPKAPKGAGKNLASVVCDERSDIDGTKLHLALAPVVEERGYVVMERIAQARSTPETVGLMYADLVGYLAARVDTISNDAELFEGLTKEQLESNGKIKKLRSSTELINKIKKFDIYKTE